jgi:hypothetical protein
MNAVNLPKHVFSGRIKGSGHIQGIATDGEYMYYSFTTLLLKTDLKGNPVGSVVGLTGHLGCIAWSEADRCIIGSLEYKNDAIGRGILSSLGKSMVNPDAFYIARFEADKIGSTDNIRLNQHAGEVMTVVKLDDVCEDYSWEDGNLKHRYGCSGIDGITVVPDLMGERSIVVAYGIYGDTARMDNDNQILLRYSADRITAAFRPLKDTMAGIRADDKIFVFTGNTTYGVQNLEYDQYTGCIFAAVYKGKKPHFPNYSLYFIDPRPFVRDGRLWMPLANRGILHEPTGIYGCNFRYGSTGMVSLGDGYYYFSEDGSDEGHYYTDIHMYRLVNDSNFERV